MLEKIRENMAAKPILSQEVINFLESNFVVYDPVYRQCYQDFSGLGNCQVYLIGSMHHSNVIENIQRKFFETVSGNEDVCVIAEGLSNTGEPLHCEFMFSIAK